ncbi:MAG: serine/threonine protein kinase [Lachnospiraceae bacterium]|nr:serine/threonine protein kinase [Lachnospiraceae bacterium]
MTLEEECRLSYYQQIATLDEDHQVFLVQHTESNGIYVRKTLENYDIGIFHALKNHPVPGIPRIYELIEDAAELNIIEEYISGDSLQTILNEKGSLPEETAGNIIRQLCDILNPLHSMNLPVIHRDIKPSNIILTPAGEVRLLDLDAAKHVQEDQTRDTRLLGTQGYAAPEQYGFGSSGICTDIYSLGVLLNVLLTGGFPAEKPADGRMGKIIAKCTQINPRDRYQSVQELIRAIDGRMEKDESPTPVQEWRRFLPPGFRSGNPVFMGIAIIGYLLLVYTSAFFVSKDGADQPTRADRIGMFLAGIAVILFSCNYLNIWKKTGITRITNRSIRLAAVLAADILITFVVATATIILKRLLAA